MKRITKATLEITLRKSAEQLQKTVTDMQTMRAEVAAGQYKYKAELLSLWSKEGEKDIIHVGSNWRKTLAAAEIEFKEANSRSDVQAELILGIVTESGFEYIIYYGNLTVFHETYVGKKV